MMIVEAALKTAGDAFCSDGVLVTLGSDQKVHYTDHWCSWC